jgi:Fe-Mn family superoxide dismutase
MHARWNHTKHHNAYTTNLNATAGTDMEGKTIDNILLNLDMKNTAVRNNGGFYNHNLYWNVMTPNGGGLLTEIC